MTTHLGTNSPLDDQTLATMAVAGIRICAQAVHSATNGASTTYTVTDVNAKRVMVAHQSSGAGDIRVNLNAAATAVHMPVFPQRYMVLEAGYGETVRFYNNTGAPVDVNIVEML